MDLYALIAGRKVHSGLLNVTCSSVQNAVGRIHFYLTLCFKELIHHFSPGFASCGTSACKRTVTVHWAYSGPLDVSYPTAWLCLHKLRRAMVREDQDLLSGEVEVDECYVGGVREGRHGSRADGKSIVLIAVEKKMSDKTGRPYLWSNQTAKHSRRFQHNTS